MRIKLLKDTPEEPVSHNINILKKVILRHGEIPGITQFAQTIFPSGQVASEHIHKDMYEIFLIESGVGLMRIDGQGISLEKGTCITVEPGELHEITNTGNEDLVVLILGILKNESC